MLDAGDTMMNKKKTWRLQGAKSLVRMDGRRGKIQRLSWVDHSVSSKIHQ